MGKAKPQTIGSRTFGWWPRSTFTPNLLPAHGPHKLHWGEVSRMSRFSFIDDESPSLSQLPAFSLLGACFDSLAQRPLCRLADLFNPFKDMLALPFIYRHPVELPAVWGLDDRNR